MLDGSGEMNEEQYFDSLVFHVLLRIECRQQAAAPPSSLTEKEGAIFGLK
jgi:hypothetical protein